VLGAMKGVASVELKRLEMEQPVGMELVEEMKGLFRTLSEAGVETRLLEGETSLRSKRNNLSAPEIASSAKDRWRTRNDADLVLVLLTTESGFVGDLNAQVVRRGMELIDAVEGAYAVLVIGGQGHRLLLEQRVPHTFFENSGRAYLSPEVRLNLEEAVLEQLFRKRLHRVVLVYSKFHSIGYQEMVAEQLLPWVGSGEIASSAKNSAKNLGGSAAIGGGRWRTRNDADAGARNDAVEREFEIETSMADSEEQIVRWWVGAWLEPAAWNTKLSELGSRILHLESSTDELDHLIRELRQTYLRKLHEEIDQQIRETYASQLVGRT